MRFYLIAGVFPVSLLIYYLINKKYRVPVLFISSLCFVSLLSLGVGVFSLVFSLANYFFGIVLGKVHSRAGGLKDRLFWIFIALDAGILGFFKYFEVFLKSFNSYFFSDGIYEKIPLLTIMIPVGISYYTFQALGYLIRIDRGSEKAQYNFFVFATYLLFFPKFLSGPVERSNHFFPQLANIHNLKGADLESGFRLILWGAFKKIVIADNLYPVVSSVYGDVHQHGGISLILVLFIQTVYIYCDFSGYTHIALGMAKCLGIDLIDNFKRPFLAKNISDFWRRWHISLSSWCNDFIYNPFIVKYRQMGNTAVIMGIFLTFFIVGIWHGANLTFVILGLLQGIAIVYEFYTKRYRIKFASKLPDAIVTFLSRVIVFIFMSFSMIFFFANSVTDACYFITHLFANERSNFTSAGMIADKGKFLMAIFIFLTILIYESLEEKKKVPFGFLSERPVFIRWSAYVICAAFIITMFSGIHIFYYARF